MKNKLIEINEHSAALIVGGLKDAKLIVEGDLSIMEIARKSELPDDIRDYLPTQLRNFSRSELIEQIDSWKTLVAAYDHLIDEFNTENW